MAFSNLSSNISKSSNTIEVYRGQSKTFELTIKDSTNAAVDLTGASIYFTVKKEVTDTVAIISKTTDDPLQAEILAPNTDGKARIYLIPSDTSVLDVGDYLFDIWVQLSSGKRYPIVEVSKFIIKASVTLF